MLKIEKRLVGDSALLIVAQAVNKVIGFFYNVFLAKVLGVGSFGEYILALSVFGLMGAVADLGMNQWLVRQVAINPGNKARVMEVLVSRYIVAVIGFAGILGYLLYSNRLGDGSNRSGYILLAVAAVLPQVLGATMDAIAIGMRKFGVSAISLVVMSVGQVLLGVWFSLWWGVNGTLSAFFLGQLCYALTLMVLLRGFEMRLRVSKQGIRSALRESMPFGLLMLIGMAYVRLDAILIGVLKGSFEVGIYGAGYKFFEAVSIVPSAVGSAIYPYFAKLSKDNPHKLDREFIKIMVIVVIMALPIIVSYWVFVPWLIQWVLPKYLGSIEVIKVLSLGIPFYFAHNVASVYLLSRGQGLAKVVFLTAVVLAINGILNIWLIPRYGYMASAWVGVVSELSALLIYLGYAKLPRKWNRN